MQERHFFLQFSYTPTVFPNMVQWNDKQSSVTFSSTIKVMLSNYHRHRNPTEWNIHISRSFILWQLGFESDKSKVPFCKLMHINQVHKSKVVYSLHLKFHPSLREPVILTIFCIICMLEIHVYTHTHQPRGKWAIQDF